MKGESKTYSSRENPVGTVDGGNTKDIRVIGVHQLIGAISKVEINRTLKKMRSQKKKKDEEKRCGKKNTSDFEASVFWKAMVKVVSSWSMSVRDTVWGEPHSA